VTTDDALRTAVIGSSRRSVEDAIRDGLARVGPCAPTEYRVTEVRARVLDGIVEHFQVALSRRRENA
jgi:flavin-binding protein dodecin